MSPALIGALAKADTQLIGWLARDKANAQRFLADPVTALSEAGVQLERSQLKELSRLSTAAHATQVVPPGAVTAVSVQAFPKGRVGGVGTFETGGSPGLGAKTEAFGCLPKRKG